MGCTSSAPKMVLANPDATDKISELSEEEQSIKEDDDIMSAEKENGNNEIKVLPSCDTLADPIQLDSNNKSMIFTSNLGLEKDITFNDNEVTEIVNQSNIAKEETMKEDKEKEDKLSSLEKVVEKVVELFVTENLTNNAQNVPNPPDQIIVDDSIEKVPALPDPPEQSKEDAVDQTNESTEDPLEEALSPSQSTSSRATRWEALADIAAELPPSLTVDPITGQIYALSK